jgi:outer membrane biosynthesis protein TonB
MDASIRSRSAALTVLIHGLIFLALVLCLMKIKIPPFEGGGGVLVSIGTVDEASGEVQPMSETVTQVPVPEKVVSQTAPEAKVVTQDFEEVNVAAPKKETKVEKPVKTEPKPVKIETKVVPPKVDQKAIYHGKTTTSTSQGNGKGKGDEGNPEGDPTARYTGKAGTGTGGEGGGSGSGIGPNSGPFNFSLKGRKMLTAPQIKDQSQETGRVVVEISVDKEGIVTNAIPGVRGSTTTSSYLFKLAKEAAYKAKFNESPDNADIQKGTITFDFLLQ